MRLYEIFSRVVWPNNQGKEDNFNLLTILVVFYEYLKKRMNFIQFEKGQIQVVALGEVAERLPNFPSCQAIHFANFLM